MRDLGSHLVDQALWQLGPAKTVHAQWDLVERPQGITDAGFVLTIVHTSGVHSHVSASKLNHLAVREFRAYGEAGSYVSSGTDVQAQAIFAGVRPAVLDAAPQECFRGQRRRCMIGKERTPYCLLAA